MSWRPNTHSTLNTVSLVHSNPAAGIRHNDLDLSPLVVVKDYHHPTPKKQKVTYMRIASITWKFPTLHNRINWLYWPIINRRLRNITIEGP